MNKLNWTKQNVLVTGGTGFIGANLAVALHNSGANVFVIERDSRSINSLKALGKYKEITIVSGSISDPSLMERVFNEHDINYCFHLAAQAIVGPANHSPLSTFEANIKGTWCVLEAARNTRNFKGMVVASSDKAYGVHKKLPYTEEFRLNGRFPYDASKVCTDVLAQSYIETYGLPIAITRNANTYGPADLHASRLIPSAILSAMRGEQFIIRSDGLMKRDYMHVQDAVEGYMLLAECIDQPNVKGEAFNFGTGIPYSVLEVVELIGDLVGGEKISPAILGNTSSEIPNQFLDVTKATNQWGWKARISLEDGLRSTIEWYKNQ
jgi:CDP-glucose 4,6-dehydratase